METMAFQANYKFSESYIPPRCRKPRYRDAQGTATVQIPVVLAEEAPVALSHMKGIRGLEGYYRKDYRWYNGQLYTRDRDYAGARYLGVVTVHMLADRIEKTFKYKKVMDADYNEVHTMEAAEAVIQAEYDNYLLIVVDGRKQVWMKAGEPRYCIHTFGLGHNHGGIGTDLSIENYFNSNLDKSCYFSALQHEEAKAEAMRTAKVRGDTDSFKYIRKAPRIKVLIPEAVRCNPNDAGEGDAFQRKLKDITMMGTDTATTAVLAMMATAKEIRKD